MEPQSIANGFQWIGLAVIGFFGAIGGGLVLYLVKRYFGGKDGEKKTKEGNNANQLTADAGFRDDLIERVGILEGKLEKLQDAFNSQMQENATIKAENTWLKKDGERKEKEIEKLEEKVAQLRKERRESDKLIGDLRHELDSLKQRFDGTPPLEVKIVDESSKSLPPIV